MIVIKIPEIGYVFFPDKVSCWAIYIVTRTFIVMLFFFFKINNEYEIILSCLYKYT